MSEIVAVPKAAVEDGGKLFVPFRHALRRESPVEHGTECLFVAFHNGIDVFCGAGSSLDFEDADASLHHFVHEADGLQVLRAHDVFVIYVQLHPRLAVSDGETAAADLHALAAVGGASEVLQGEVALPADRHAQRAVAEHLQSDGLSRRPANLFFFDGAVNVGDLLQVQFARKDGDVGEAGIEAKRLHV